MKTYQALNVFIIILAFSAKGYSQGTSTSMRELLIPQTAQSASLGISNVASPTFDGVFLNPANATRISSMNILLSIHEWMVGTTLYTIGVLTPTRFGTIAVVSWNLSTPNIEYRLRPGPSEGSFTYRTSFYSLIYAKSILENLSIGLSWKYITNKIFVTEKDGYSFDIGFHYTITPLIFSLSFLNAGEFGNSEKLPTSIITGCSYDYYFSTITTTLFCALSSELHNHYIRGHVGAEVNYINTLFARFGYVSGFDSHNLSFGVGLHIGFVKVDYSYIPFRYSFGNSHCVTLQFSLD